MRHGEVENPKAIRYGRLPGYHLSAEGRESVTKAAEFFIDRPIEHIYSSPLERTQQTATLIGLALPKVEISLDKRILETKTAKKFEGKSRDAAFYIPDRPTEGAESKEEIIARMYQFLEEKTIKHHGKEVIAVSHGDPIALLYNKLTYDAETTKVTLYPRYASIVSFVMLGLQLSQVWYQDLCKLETVLDS